MRIEVVVKRWEQACCGAAFRVGDDVIWNLLAADPASTTPGGLSRFEEEHHDQTPDDVPHWEVTGTVRSIRGVSYPRIPVRAERRSFTLDTAHPATTPLSEVEEASGAGLSKYWVELDVADECELPPFVSSDSVRE
ncbi:hypothetical protein J2Y69_000526 [Microbacterium resistens]|uniref:Uncharacterized protein n=1 Tax=Microbacterium resistens TaxID=156977 RepID=A0ABU1S8J9_9MICO|nr:DUF6578 domain-containing protein [Microbacterium resistens]MDR6865941.1 hypothetical protein [Microbacterium resistens]